jgi:signal transduction histidine kinase
MTHPGKSRLSEPALMVVTAIMVLVIAALAGGALWTLRYAHSQLAHDQAARGVLEEGARLTAFLATLPVVRTATDQTDWQSLSPLVRSLHAAEKGVQYVSLSCDGATVFHEQTIALDGSPGTTNRLDLPLADVSDVRMTRKLLRVGDQIVPVVVFAVRFMGEDGRSRLLELALRKETVDREESAPVAAVSSMFRVSLTTIVISFLICVVLVLWMMHREHRREQRRRAEEHLTFAGVLANGIVHDFRNPMSSLRLDAQMLEREAAKGADSRADRIAELSVRMRTTLDRMDTVFQEFLYVSRPAEVQTETIDLGACLRECVGMMIPRFEQKGLKVAIETGEDRPLVTARRSPIQRAFLNILSNAEHFSPPESTVSVRVSRAAGSAVVEIRDQGPGIPEADRTRIFEMFYTGRPGGTGLGLFIARTAIENSGGSIQVDNGPQGGAVFRVALPLGDRRS